MSNDLGKYVPPSSDASSFNCPHPDCRTFAHQTWYLVRANRRDDPPGPPGWLEWDDPTLGESYSSFDPVVENVHLSLCYSCGRIAIWVRDFLVYPKRPQAEVPPADPDLPNHISEIYDEAASILNRSPRGAAGLLRLAIQLLFKELDLPGEKINADIGTLVARGLDARVQQALDSVRVIGNNALHPGEIDIKDDQATAVSLLRLVNFIAARTISAEKHVEEIYQGLPETELAKIENRDKKIQKNQQTTDDEQDPDGSEAL